MALITNTTSKPCKCTLCDVEFPSITKMEAHRKTCTLTCADCGQVFKKRASHAKHLDTSPCQTHKIPCQICQVKFKEHFQLANQLRDVHGDETPWKCSQCPMEFQRQDVFQRHINEKHKGIKRKEVLVECVCSCGYAPTRKLNWDRHINVCPAHRTGARAFLQKALANSKANSPEEKVIDALYQTVEAARQALLKQKHTA